MSRVLALSALLVVLPACGQSAPPASPPAGSAPAAAPAAEAGARSDIDMTAFIALDRSNMALVDVRTPGEFAGGHVPGAVLAPMGEIGPEHPAVKDHPKSEPLYVICQSGGRSSRAADQLASAGYTVVNVKGGTGAWVAAGQPVETPSAQ